MHWHAYTRLWFHLLGSLTLCLAAISPAVHIVHAQTSTGNLVINAIAGQQITGQNAYTTKALVSVVDDDGNPVPNLSLGDFTAAEDSLPVELADVSAVTSPINLILAIDVSQSMSGGGKLGAVVEAATRFVDSLKAEDQVALISFSGEIQRKAELTSNHQLVADQLGQLQPEPGGTCLYDAAREAVELASAVAGRRAILLLTDGRDEVQQADTVSPCSTAIFEDVANLATDTIRVPIYTVTVGTDADTQSMARLAQQTGGLSAQIANSVEIGPYFELLAQQLSSQYELSYRSVAAPGPHTLYIAATVEGVKLDNTRSFVLPDLAAVPIIIAPANGATLNGTATVKADVKGSGDVNRLALLVDGEEVTSDSTTPFEFEWDSSEALGKTVRLEVVIFDSANTELARSEAVTVSIEAPASPVPTQVIVVTQPSQQLSSSPPIFDLVWWALILAVAGGLIFFSWRWWQGRQQANYVVWTGTSGEPFASLILEQSDTLDAGRRFDLRKPVTTLGRSANNDIILPDKPVSRTHAELRETGGKLTLVEVKSEQDGKLQAPRYGTFVNDAPVPVAGKPLKHGDRIRLGSRTTLRLERLEVARNDLTFDSLSANDHTFDQLTPPKDPDATREMPEEPEVQLDETRQLLDETAPTVVHKASSKQDDGTREFSEPTTPANPEDRTRELRASPKDEGDAPDDATRAVN